ncbi:MAG: hypothetical protein AB7N76_18130 [Planctomycetota bacterium]
MPFPFLALHLVLAVLAAALGWSLGARVASGADPAVDATPPPESRARAAIALALLALLALELALRLIPERVANALPHPELALLCDLSPQLALALLAFALRSERARATRLRIGLLGSALVACAVWGHELPYLPSRAPLGPAQVDARGPQAVVRQSTPHSCAAAAAATLLRARGLEPDASEAELARDCLTDARRGTTPLGLLRGLSRHAPGRRVRYLWPSEEELGALGPCVLHVGLSDQVRDPELRRVLRDQCGWPEGVVHAVVCFGFAAGGAGEEPRVALIGDPRLGYERWGLSHLRALWHGAALVIEER